VAFAKRFDEYGPSGVRGGYFRATYLGYVVGLLVTFYVSFTYKYLVFFILVTPSGLMIGI